MLWEAEVLLCILVAFKVVPFFIPDLPRSYSVHTPFFRNVKIYAVSIFRPAKNTPSHFDKKLKNITNATSETLCHHTVGEG